MPADVAAAAPALNRNAVLGVGVDDLPSAAGHHETASPAPGVLAAIAQREDECFVDRAQHLAGDHISDAVGRLVWYHRNVLGSGLTQPAGQQWHNVIVPKAKPQHVKKLYQNG